MTGGKDMTVDTFDPNASNAPIDAALFDDICRCAARLQAAAAGGEVLPLTQAEVTRYATVARHPDWADQARGVISSETLIQLVRLFTLGEMQFATWVAGDQSPVIALVRELKRREQYDPALTRWIKAHSTNRFLPHGNLLDRL